MMQGQTPEIPKSFPLEEVFDAASAKKKVMPKTEPLLDDKGVQVTTGEGLVMSRITFEDSEKDIEFTPSEIVILKRMFDEKKDWSTEITEPLQQLKDIFYPPKKE